MNRNSPALLVPLVLLVLSCVAAPEVSAPREPVEVTIPQETTVPVEVPPPAEASPPVEAAPEEAQQEPPLEEPIAPEEIVLPEEAAAPEDPGALPEGALPRRAIDGFTFTLEPYTPRFAAPGVGNITRERRDRASALGVAEKSLLSGAFRDAYIDGLLRNQALAGVLGGDQVHGWPMANPLSWVQNWETSEPRPNSWGLPSLVLAVIPNEEAGQTEQARVFTVEGTVLDFYGKGAGLNGANGNAGFGSPRGREFLLEGNLAQRFDHGVIVIDESGKGAFTAEPRPSSQVEITPGLVEELEFPSTDVLKAFFTAWKLATDSGLGRGRILVPDAKAVYIAAEGYDGDAAVFDGIDAKGFYLLTFNRVSSAIILLDAPGLPNHARFVGAPFMELLQEGIPAAGTEIQEFAGTYLEQGPVENLLAGLAVYGLPLSDPVYKKNETGTWITAQRFAKGWLECAAAP